VLLAPFLVSENLVCAASCRLLFSDAPLTSA
jgi:hypothetical protein